jgi:hypothetical protein
VKCEVIECEATGDWLWATLYEQFGQMDKYSSRTQVSALQATLSPIPILYYVYCMMLLITYLKSVITWTMSILFPSGVQLICEAGKLEAVGLGGDDAGMILPGRVAGDAS